MSEQHEEQVETSRKEVLVMFGKRMRSLSFNKDEDPEVELANFEWQARVTFEDVFKPNSELIIKLKDEKWNGEFVDLSPTSFISDQSVVKVVS